MAQSALIAAIGLPFIPGWEQLRPFVGELVLIGTIVAVLVAPFFTRRANLACGAVALAGVCIALVAVLASGVGTVGMHFVSLLVADPFALLWKVLLYLFVAGVIVMWFTTSYGSMHEGDGPEFFTLLLGATLGMSLMGATSNLLMLVIAVEMASLPSYVLAGFRKTHPVGAEASLKYVLFGAVTSAVMIYGVSLLYGMYGTLEVGAIARQLSAAPAGGSALLIVSVLGLIAGLGFKISAVPFHFWCPDVFEGAGIDVATFLSVASKGAALALLLRVLLLIGTGVGFADVPGISLSALAIAIGVLGAVTATVGNTAAFVQTNIKRLLAYSSIAHAGYMLCALSLIVKHNAEPAISAGTLMSSEAAAALLLYLAVYLFMNLGAFTVAGLIYRATGSENIEDYADLGWRRAPVVAVAMACCLFSLVGLPPFAGFVAKLKLMLVLGGNGAWWWALVAVIGLNTIFSLYYYARVVKVMYLTPSDAPAVSVNPLGTGLALACAAMLLVMLIGFGPLNRLAASYGKLYLKSAQTVSGVVVQNR